MVVGIKGWEHMPSTMLLPSPTVHSNIQPFTGAVSCTCKVLTLVVGAQTVAGMQWIMVQMQNMPCLSLQTMSYPRHVNHPVHYSSDA